MRSKILLSLFLFSPVLLMAQWQSTYGPETTSAVTCYAFKDNMVFAGTFFNSGKIFRSMNKGTFWEEVDGGLPLSSAFNVSSLVVDGEFLFAGTNRGIWKSSDNGDHWTPANTGLTDTTVVLMGKADNYLFAFSSSTVFRSSDHGLTWELSLHINGYLNGSSSFIQKGSNIFFSDFYNGIFKSQNFGTSWEKVLDYPSYTMANIGNQLLANALGNLLIRSEDDGLNWDILNDTLYISRLIVKDSSIFIGGERGFYRSDDAGNTWISISNGIPFASPLAMDADDSSVYACTSNLNGTSYRTDNNGINWVKANNGLPFDRVTALATHWTSVYAGTNGGGVFQEQVLGFDWNALNSMLSSFKISSIVVDEDGIFAGTDGGVFIYNTVGEHWLPFNNGLTNKNVNVIFKNSGKLFTGTEGGGIFLSPDDGYNWIAMNNGLTNLMIRSICTKGDTVFCGTHGGGVFRSTDQGTFWTSVNTGLTNQNINSLICRGNDLYAGTEGGVFISSDKGNSWSSYNSGLMNTFITSFTLGRSQLFAGTNKGVYRYSDSGQKWVKVSDMLPDTIVSSLAASNTDLFAGIVSRGVWTRPLSDFNLLEIDPDILTLAAKSFSKDTISVFASGDWVLQGTLPDWLSVDKWQGTGNDILVFNTVKDNPENATRSAGFYVTSASGSSVAFTVVQKARPEGIDRQTPEALHIYPVPSTGIINWEFNIPIIKLEVFDPSGKIVFEQWADKKSGAIDLSSERKGLYFIRIVTDSGVTTRSVTIM